MKTFILGLIGLLFTCAAVEASETEEETTHMTPLQVSVWNPVQLAPEDWDVCGLRLNLPYGNNRDVHGIDIGIANNVTRSVIGIQIGIQNQIEDWKHIFGIVSGGEQHLTGVQLGSWNRCWGSVTGLQIGGYNLSGRLKGAQLLGTFNDASGFDGVQFGLFNSANRLPFRTDSRGLQLGVWNCADSMKGLQVGLVNYTRTMTGVQIGAINIIRENAVPFLPVINVSF